MALAQWATRDATKKPTSGDRHADEDASIAGTPAGESDGSGGAHGRLRPSRDPGQGGGGRRLLPPARSRQSAVKKGFLGPARADQGSERGFRSTRQGHRPVRRQDAG